MRRVACSNKLWHEQIECFWTRMWRRSQMKMPPLEPVYRPEPDTRRRMEPRRAGASFLLEVPGRRR